MASCGVYDCQRQVRPAPLGWTTEYVRALNLVISDGDDVVMHSRYSEDPDYFTLHHAALSDGPNTRLVCSERLEIPEVSPDWVGLANGVTARLEGAVPCSS